MYKKRRGALAVVAVALSLSSQAWAEGCPSGELIFGSDAPKPETIYIVEAGKARPLVGEVTYRVCVGDMSRVKPVLSQQIASMPPGDPYASPGVFLCDFDPTPTPDKPKGHCTTIYWMDEVTDVARPFGDWGAYKKQNGPDNPEENGVVHLMAGDPITTFFHNNLGSVISTDGGSGPASTCYPDGTNPGFPCSGSPPASCALPTPGFVGMTCSCSTGFLGGTCGWPGKAK